MALLLLLVVSWPNPRLKEKRLFFYLFRAFGNLHKRFYTTYITGGAYPVDGGSLVSVFHLTAELMELSKQQKND
jgi:hypothetical protein